MALILDRQLVAILDQFHRTQTNNHYPCRWFYNGRSDTYYCSHIQLQGRELVEVYESRNYFPNRQEV